MLRSLGIPSEIYAGESRDVPRGSVHPHDRFRPRGRPEGTFILYQSATGSPVGDYVLSRPERKLVNYHNITPSAFFRPWLPHVAGYVEQGRHQLAKLAPVCELGIAVSSFNERDLVKAGFPLTVVAPVIVDFTVFDRAVDSGTLAELDRAKRNGGGSDWLFVGRVAPHKAQHDLVTAFALYRSVYDRQARLHLVGGYTQGYAQAVMALAEELGIAGAINFADSVSPGALTAYYQRADVFVSASDHEGFGVPLLEAMYHRVPIVAYAAAAVPETLSGGAGLLLDEKRPAVLAAAVNRVCTDGELREQLVKAGEAKLEDYSLERTRGAYAEIFERLLVEATMAGEASS